MNAVHKVQMMVMFQNIRDCCKHDFEFECESLPGDMSCQTDKHFAYSHGLQRAALLPHVSMSYIKSEHLPTALEQDQIVYKVKFVVPANRKCSQNRIGSNVRIQGVVF